MISDNFRIVRRIYGNEKALFLPQYRLLWFFWLNYEEYDDVVITCSSYEEALRVIREREEEKCKRKRRKRKIFSIKEKIFSVKI